MTRRYAIESWSVDYGSSLLGEDDLVETSGPVDVAIEVPAEQWAPITPSAVSEVADVLFVDGVRRMDARVWVTDGDSTRQGLCVSYAAGTVRCNGAAVIEACEVRRGFFAPGGVDALETTLARYEPFTVATDDSEALFNGVQQQMGALEIAVVGDAPPADLVVVDGPLSGRQHVPGAIGYVKSHRVAYLPPVVAHVVPTLGPGQRTPLFVTQTSWSRFSWYVRLPGGTGHPWAGIVRCEAAAETPLDEVRRTADTTAALLPRYASDPHKDPRAPQNLYPIAGLERALRRRLGDARLLERALRAAVAPDRAP